MGELHREVNENKNTALWVTFLGKEIRKISLKIMGQKADQNNGDLSRTRGA